MDTKILLSKEFVEFSSKITALHEKREEFMAEFKRVHDEFKANLADIDTKAKEAQDEFDAWVKGQSEPSEKKPSQKGQAVTS